MTVFIILKLWIHCLLLRTEKIGPSVRLCSTSFQKSFLPCVMSIMLWSGLVPTCPYSPVSHTTLCRSNVLPSRWVIDLWAANWRWPFADFQCSVCVSVTPHSLLFALCCGVLSPLILVISLKLWFTATWLSCHIHTQRGVEQEANDGCVIWWDRHCHAAHAARFQLKLHWYFQRHYTWILISTTCYLATCLFELN